MLITKENAREMGRKGGQHRWDDLAPEDKRDHGLYVRVTWAELCYVNQLARLRGLYRADLLLEALALAYGD